MSTRRTRRTGGSGVRRPAAAAGLAAALVTLCACIQIPESGPVESAESRGNPAPESQQRVAPRGPQDGDTPEETVTRFLEAMLARPMSATVARSFLTDPESSGWRPEQGFLTYADKSSPTGTDRLQVTLTGVNRFDARGGWLGRPARGTRTLSYEMASQAGQWRIADAEDALVVSSDWFAENTTPLSLYFFAPGATTLVPEPVFVADGEQKATMLVRGLLDGPVDPRVQRSFLPPGLTLSLSVSVRDGVATIPLEGGTGGVAGEVVDLMAAQLAWTLRQVPSISSLRITLDGAPVALSSGDVEFPVGLGSVYDATGTLTREELYGLLDQVVVRMVEDEVDTLPGPFGSRRLGLQDISVDLAASQIAGVTADDRVLLTSVGIGDSVSTVLRGDDVLHPAWDFSDRLWILDNRPSGAVVFVRQAGSEVSAVRPVTVPGVSGGDVVDFLVSRDGTRLVAAVRHASGDRIVSVRIRGTDAASTAAVGPPRVIVGGVVGAEEGVGGAVAQRLRVQDLGWRSATAIYYLRSLGGRQSELRSAIVDGSPTEFDPDAFLGVLANQNVRVVSSPRADEAVYLQRAGGGYSGVAPESPVLTGTGGLTALVYVG